MLNLVTVCTCYPYLSINHKEDITKWPKESPKSSLHYTGIIYKVCTLLLLTRELKPVHGLKILINTKCMQRLSEAKCKWNNTVVKPRNKEFFHSVCALKEAHTYVSLGPVIYSTLLRNKSR